MEQSLVNFIKTNFSLNEFENEIKQMFLREITEKGKNPNMILSSLNKELKGFKSVLLEYYNNFVDFSGEKHKGTSLDVSLGVDERYSKLTNRTWFKFTQRMTEVNVYGQNEPVPVGMWDYSPTISWESKNVDYLVNSDGQLIEVSEILKQITPPKEVLDNEIQEFFDVVHERMDRNASEIVFQLVMGKSLEEYNDIKNKRLSTLQKKIILQSPLFAEKQWRNNLVKDFRGKLQNYLGTDQIAQKLQKIKEIDENLNKYPELAENFDNLSKLQTINETHKSILKTRADEILKLQTKFNSLRNALYWRRDQLKTNLWYKIQPKINETENNILYQIQYLKDRCKAIAPHILGELKFGYGIKEDELNKVAEAVDDAVKIYTTQISDCEKAFVKFANRNDDFESLANYKCLGEIKDNLQSGFGALLTSIENEMNFPNTPNVQKEHLCYDRNKNCEETLKDICASLDDLIDKCTTKKQELTELRKIEKRSPATVERMETQLTKLENEVTQKTSAHDEEQELVNRCHSTIEFLKEKPFEL